MTTDPAVKILTDGMDKVIQEIIETTGTADGRIHIPVDLLRKMIAWSYNDGKLAANIEQRDRLMAELDALKKGWQPK